MKADEGRWMQPTRFYRSLLAYTHLWSFFSSRTFINGYGSAFSQAHECVSMSLSDTSP